MRLRLGASVGRAAALVIRDSGGKDLAPEVLYGESLLRPEENTKGAKVNFISMVMFSFSQMFG